jgi:hypothetical protein
MNNKKFKELDEEIRTINGEFKLEHSELKPWYDFMNIEF